ncbi:MAG: DUF1232 domain-containing protein [Bdellovibrionales bacterium]|nr:DUF1232 domain-containing protein [Bdellovibrionales bacterium]
MLKKFVELKDFIVNVARDERIPQRDKKVILALLALILSPIDIIPDWIPVLGILDDIVLLATILDYFFDVLDQEILLTHFPWSLKSYQRLRRLARIISQFTPRWLKRSLWKFTGSPYK